MNMRSTATFLKPLPTAIAFVLSLAATMLADPAVAAPQSSPSPAVEDLGQELLNDDLLRDLLAEPATSNSAASPPEKRLAVPTIPPALPSATPPAGEDLGQQRPSPLANISTKMQAAQQLIMAPTISSQTKQVQQEVLHDLEQLIDRLNQQCQQCRNGQCNKPAAPQPSQASTPQPSGAKPAGKPASASAQQASNRQSTTSPTGKEQAATAFPNDDDTLKQLWGQLPERLRQQLLQTSSGDFLPEYREQIQAYFRRLANEHQTAGEQ